MYFLYFTLYLIYIVYLFCVFVLICAASSDCTVVCLGLKTLANNILFILRVMNKKNKVIALGLMFCLFLLLRLTGLRIRSEGLGHVSLGFSASVYILCNM